jgi:hypothetical protein
MAENNRNNSNPPPRKKRRWYYKSRPPTTPTTTTTTAATTTTTTESTTKPQQLAPPPSRQDILKQHEKERIENEKQVSNMEQQLHNYFHKSNTPYSFVDENGIYKFTPKTPINPFMNMTFTPFIPSFTPQTSAIQTNIWGSIFPFQNVVPIVPVPPAVPIVPEFIEIRENIQHIDDLIALCEKYPLSETKKYNINMSAIHAIRDPLRDLSNMIGMDTIKQTIVDQILYYLQELHIPVTSAAAKDTNVADAAADAAAAPTKDETNEPIFNPFAIPFSSGSAGAASSAKMGPPPPMFDFKTLNQRISENIKKNSMMDDGANMALPAKGDFMHTVIYGPPGSGKTEVAKIIGRIFSNLGILNKKIFKKVSRNDLVAGYLGQTAIKTKDMIKASLGGVLFIDEAYSLGNSEKRDSFAKECVDTLCEALSEHKHNWMVIIAGYEKELNDCFFALNEGLNSRFTWRFKLDGYKPGELKSIFEKQVRDYGWTIDPTAALPESWFESRMDYFTTYGRDMETLFTKTKIAHSRRVFCLPVSNKKIVTLADLESGFKLFIENPEVKERKERGCGPYMKTLYL